MYRGHEDMLDRTGRAAIMTNRVGVKRNTQGLHSLLEAFATAQGTSERDVVAGRPGVHRSFACSGF
jgi:hypothetical protein